MKIWFLLFSVACCFLSLKAQNFRGIVLDKSGRPIPYASIFIFQKGIGITADMHGSFSVVLEPGYYSYSVYAPNYNSVSGTLYQTNSGNNLSIILNPRIYTTSIPDKYRNEVNPAMPIVNAAIEHAPDNFNKIASYSASVYVKNRIKVVKIPGFQKISKAMRKLAHEYQGRLVTEEQQQHIDFHAPYNYDISTQYRTNLIPEEIEPNLNLNTLNIYARTIYDKLSPIAKEAPRYYRYIFVCSITDQGQTIYKIQVIPKHLESVLVSGFIYINQQTWSIKAYDLLIYNSDMTANIHVNCSEVRPHVFMPTSQHTILNYHKTGIQTLQNITHSIRYYSMNVCNDIDTLASKPSPEKEKYPFERSIKDNKSINKFTVLTRDSTLWNQIRTSPLLPEENVTYNSSLPQEEEPFHAKDWSDIRTWWNLLVKGDYFTTRSGKQWIKCYQVSTVVPEFNFVDGLWIGYKLGLGIRFSKSAYLELTPSLYYTTARKVWLNNTDLSFYYAPHSQGRLSIGLGRYSTDFNEETGESRLFNSLSALIYADNYIKLFDKRFFSISHQIEPFNGLLFTASASWEKRSRLSNYLHHSILGQDAEKNDPTQYTDFIMNDSKVIKTKIGLEYTPAHYYHMDGDKKVYENTANPTFKIEYTKAFGWEGCTSKPSYSKMQVSIHQDISFGLFNHFVWNAEAGMFYDKHDIQFPDLHHFPMVQNTSSTRPFSYGFFLQDCYTFSTDQRWMMINTTWSTPYLLVKYLPIFRYKKFDEAVHARFLATPDEHPYIEMGYSAGVEDRSRIGVFMSFDRGGYKSVGVSLSFAM